MVMTRSHVDKYAPRVTGVNNVFLEAKSDDKYEAQTWWYDDIDHTIHNVEVKNDVLLEGSNMNYATYKEIPFRGQRFNYNMLNKHLYNTFSRRAMGVNAAVIETGGNIEAWVDTPNNIGE